MERTIQRFTCAVILCTSVLGTVSPCFSHAGVYDDAAAWWHFDYDPNHDPLAVNVAAADEIRDQRDWGTAAVKGAGGRHASGVRGVLGGPLWTNATPRSYVLPAADVTAASACASSRRPTRRDKCGPTPSRSTTSA